MNKKRSKMKTKIYPRNEEEFQFSATKIHTICFTTGFSNQVAANVSWHNVQQSCVTTY